MPKRKTPTEQEIVEKSTPKPVYRNSPTIGNNVVLPAGKAAKVAVMVQNMLPDVCPYRSEFVVACYGKLKRYINICIENDVKIGNQMCYFACGLTKDDVYDWEHGRKGDFEQSDFVKRLRQICAVSRELYMSEGQINPITGIFWQKNYDGLKDVQDVVVTPNNPLGDMANVPQIEEKYKDALPE
jgi:hypothetical protein